MCLLGLRPQEQGEYSWELKQETAKFAATKRIS